jgi:hypothetical protein
MTMAHGQPSTNKINPVKRKNDDDYFFCHDIYNNGDEYEFEIDDDNDIPFIFQSKRVKPTTPSIQQLLKKPSYSVYYLYESQPSSHLSIDR